MAADYITDTNENEGVAKAIERFILNNWWVVKLNEIYLNK
jgi:hypothetical protein